ncbi:hypothetical protein I5Q34_26385 [Streptomyces sp. AV19]|uniref:transmembrane-type terpene cyclase n=1 Tax=Streptomyces sp. AV19 TaxID=2793068 RepID=UPI0018FEB447|nr:hypothetical protein [Streptomyces sp. AV19]MBH1937758.1 hypothetical protein [Streptomyces sp. AV19]MDG4536427.1 hypothetical protein [Streptomyces sp. AV19]
MITQVVVHTFAGIFWTTAYVLIALKSRADRTYGMPLAALGANLGWEFYFTVIDPPTYDSDFVFGAQLTIDAIWLLTDFVILWYVFRHGPREFPGLSRRLCYAMFAGVIVLMGTTDVLISREFEDSYGLRVSFLQALMMSLLFLGMLQARRSLRGQSLGIAVAKMLGTAAASLGVHLRPPLPEYGHSVLLKFLYLVCLAADVVYVVAVYRIRQGRSGPARPTGKVGAGARIGGER